MMTILKFTESQKKYISFVENKLSSKNAFYLRRFLILTSLLVINFRKILSGNYSGN